MRSRPASRGPARCGPFEAAGIVPDVVCFGKAIANGLPLAGIVSSRELQTRWGVGAHGTTFGGNPVACAAAVAVLETIEGQHLAANAAAQGETLMTGLRALAARDGRLTQVRGRGLMIGVETTAELAPRLMNGAADAGLLVLLAGGTHDVVRWLPPLDVSAAEIAEGLAIFERVLAAA